MIEPNRGYLIDVTRAAFAVAVEERTGQIDLLASDKPCLLANMEDALRSGFTNSQVCEAVREGKRILLEKDRTALDNLLNRWGKNTVLHPA